jgi:hypothetical protein
MKQAGGPGVKQAPPRRAEVTRAALGSGRLAMQLEPVDLGWASEEPGCIDASDGVVVARRGLKSVRSRVILPDRDDNAVAAAASEQVSLEPAVGAEHRQRLLRGEALVFCGSCLIYLGPPDPHDHCPSLQRRAGLDLSEFLASVPLARCIAVIASAAWVACRR